MTLPGRAMGASFILPVVISGLFSLGLTALADSSATWIVLVICGAATLAAVAWVSDVKLSLIFIFFFTLPIDISKALTSYASAYAPVLQVYLSDLAFVPLATLWIFDKTVIHKSRIYWSRVHWIALLLLLWFAVSTFWGLDPVGRLLHLNHVKYFLYFVVMADLVREPRYLKGAVIGLACGLAAQLVVAALQIMTGSDLRIQGGKDPNNGRVLVFEEAQALHVRRVSGLLPHPNVFADYLTFVLPPLLTLLLLGRKIVGSLVWTLSALLFCGALIALVLALSRAGWIAFGCSLVFIFAAGYGFGIVHKRHLVALTVITVTLIGGISIVFPAAIYRVILSDDRSSESRIAMIDQAILIIERHPVLGVGLGGYTKAAQTAIPSSWALLLPDFRDTLLKGGVVHNKYLLTLAETGPVGFILLLLLLGANLCLPFSRVTWTTPEQFALMLGISAAVLAQSVFYLFEHFSYDTRIGLLYAFSGLLVGMASPRVGGVEPLNRRGDLPRLVNY
jgi:putative inorganic carbon (HCO3(-)) transporter